MRGQGGVVFERHKDNWENSKNVSWELRRFGAWRIFHSIQFNPFLKLYHILSCRKTEDYYEYRKVQHHYSLTILVGLEEV